MKNEIRSLKHNFFMYFIRAFTNFGFTLLIFPYIARKIGAEGTGKVQYIETVVSYFILVINLGILDYGKREIAQNRNNQEKLNSIVNELLSILYITTIIGSIFYFIFIKYFVISTTDKFLYLIYFFNILLNAFNVEWFYIGIENQEYITKRNLFVKIFSGILILCFVKSRTDIYIYTSILVIAMAGSNIYNFINLKKYIRLSFEKYKNYKKHLKSLFYLFSSAIALNISYGLDSIMIKNIVGDTELGYYTLAMKFGKLPLVIGATLVAVILPRLNNLLYQNSKKEYLELWNKGVNIMFIFYIPSMFGLILLAKPLILVLGGKDFLPAINIFKIFAVYIFIMGFATSTGVILGVNRKDKEYFLSVISGTLLNFTFNLIFIYKIGAIGAVIATIITEMIAIIVRIMLCKDLFKEIKLINKNMLKMFLSSFIMIIGIFPINKYISIPIIQIILSGLIGSFIYFLSLIVLKENTVKEIVNNIKLKYQNR